MPDWMTFERLGRLNVDGTIPGSLKVKHTIFPTIERGHGYVTVRRGIYTVEMSLMGKGTECLRFSERGLRNLLIHPVRLDLAMFLEGCIAPGMIRFGSGGIYFSKRAMKEILLLLGGFELRKQFLLWVRNNAPGVREEKQQWVQRRIQKRRRGGR